MKGLVFNIQRFSTKDGPGIRTTVFFKGCNVNCAWCHNPESIDGDQMLRFDSKLCINCGRCAEVCSKGAVEMTDAGRVYHLDRCTLCGDCVPVCGAGAIEIVGKNYTVEELYSIILKDADFYQESGGGVTFSGGEPLLQVDFLVEILKRLKSSGFHTAVDTALNVEWNAVEKVIPYTDLFLIDIKGMNPEAHLKNTDVEPWLIHKNMQKLAQAGVDITVRMPLVMGLNDSVEELKAAAAFIKDWPQLKGVELLAYHSLGVDKSGEYAALKQQEKFEPPTAERMAEAVRIFKEGGIDYVT